ncbi:MAG TPA: D-alanyl-D-alanine carboxypeptidase/D-alanyl-D-alanine-endopeptidase [Enhygromyxa sp.]|nr:D-alanyl-D-alanine carboxypeptidase/D-alanyl-D-alanine-endopeptidase [Enhygromyxa sp.]
MVRRRQSTVQRPLALGLAIAAALTLGVGAVAGPPEAASSTEKRQPIDAQIDALIARTELGSNAKIGVSVVDLATGKTLYARNADVALNPASNAKLVTTAAALERLGPEHRYTTRIWTEAGGIEEGVVNGKLYLQGGGDPSLVTGEIYELAGQLRSAGVERVRGPIVVDAGRFDHDGLPPGFEQKDEFASHRAPGGAMSVNYNTFEVHARPGKAIGDPPTLLVDPPVPSIEVVSEARTVAGNRNKLSVASKQDGGKIIVTFKGEVGINNGPSSYRYPVGDPSRYAGELLVLALTQRGIKVGKPTLETGDVPRDAKLLATFRSESLSELCRSVNKWSNNFMAEQILRTLVPDDGATAAASLELLRAYTVEIGMPQAGLVLGNGSGLYANNMISPAALTHLLGHVYADFRYRSDFIASLAIMGGDGTTRSRLSGTAAEGWLRVKTGTLDDVSALSGYAGAIGRDPIAFSILVNGLERKHRARARELQDKIAELLAREAQAPVAH